MPARNSKEGEGACPGARNSGPPFRSDRAGRETGGGDPVNRRWTFRTLRRYLLLQLPGTVLLVAAILLARRWIDLPVWLCWATIAAWVAKDIALFPFVRKAYEPQDGRHPIVGEPGIARDPIAPSGYVQIGGELWKAKIPDGCRGIDRGEAVRVRDVDGITLVVEADAGKPGDNTA